MKECNSNFPTYFKAQDTSGFHFEWNLPKTAFHAMTESKVHKQNVLEENIVSVSFTNRTQLSRRQRVPWYVDYATVTCEYLLCNCYFCLRLSVFCIDGVKLFRLNLKPLNNRNFFWCLSSSRLAVMQAKPFKITRSGSFPAKSH